MPFQHMAKAYRFDTYKYVDALQKEITYFLTVAETLNISKGAEILGIQQSGLSRAISRLEQDLGQKLFHRKNTGLSLSPQGERFYRAVKDTKQRWEENFKFLLNDSDMPVGLTKIGLHPSFGQLYLPGILQSITKEFPQLEMEVNDLSSHQIVRKVMENEIDFGLVISDIKNAEIVQKNIGTDFLATFRKETDSNGKLTHFLMNPETQMSGRFLKQHSQLKRIAIKDYELIAKSALNNSHTLALLPGSVALQHQGLKQVSKALVKAQISLICHKEKLKSAGHRKIYDAILNICKAQQSLLLQSGD